LCRWLEGLFGLPARNPSCEAQFKYLHEGRLFQFASAGTPTGITKSRFEFRILVVVPSVLLVNDSDSKWSGRREAGSVV